MYPHSPMPDTAPMSINSTSSSLSMMFSDEAVADEPPSGAQPRAGGLDLDRPRLDRNVSDR
jgi:hypothetical protein